MDAEETRAGDQHPPRYAVVGGDLPDRRRTGVSVSSSMLSPKRPLLKSKGLLAFKQRQFRPDSFTLRDHDTNSSYAHNGARQR
jgi:hypothetical protein